MLLLQWHYLQIYLRVGQRISKEGQEKILKYRITLWNKLKGTSIDKALSADVTLTANELVIHENLHDANLFELYNICSTRLGLTCMYQEVHNFAIN